jgi:hypothetical protein
MVCGDGRKATRYRTLVRATAFWDVLIMGGFALPGLAAWLLESLAKLHAVWSLPGAFVAFDGLHLLFVNLAGCVTLVWAALRIRRPEPLFGLYDAAMRLPIAALLCWQLAHGASALLWLFVFSELAAALLLLSWYPRARQSKVAELSTGRG